MQKGIIRSELNVIIIIIIIIIMPTKSEISDMLLELSELLEADGVPTMRGDRIGQLITKLVVIDAYADCARELIKEGGHPATVETLGQGISIIKAVY